jgi:hypothetical protein
MNAIQIEARALDIIDQIKSGLPIEDTRIELKGEWIDPKKAARQIAGHANAARHEPILWLIGIDQNNGVKGVNYNELSNWFAQVRSEFDGLAPDCLDLNVPVDGKTIVALYFDTNRAPFVVKNPKYGMTEGGNISYEVPWREGTSTRSARRSDLLKLLVPIMLIPEIELFNATLAMRKRIEEQSFYWHLELVSYIIPQFGYQCVIPFHRCEVTIEVEGILSPVRMTNLSISPPYPDFGNSGPDSKTISNTQREVIIDGPGELHVTALGTSKAQGEIQVEFSNVVLQIKLQPAYTDKFMNIHANLNWVKPKNPKMIGYWEFNA